MWTCPQCEELADDDDRTNCPYCGMPLCHACARQNGDHGCLVSDDCPGPPETEIARTALALRAEREDPVDRSARECNGFTRAYYQCTDALDAVKDFDGAPYRLRCIIEDLCQRYGVTVKSPKRSRRK
jgi:hypothetical protein